MNTAYSIFFNLYFEIIAFEYSSTRKMLMVNIFSYILTNTNLLYGLNMQNVI